jgi:hypothetical protein
VSLCTGVNKAGANCEAPACRGDSRCWNHGGKRRDIKPPGNAGLRCATCGGEDDPHLTITSDCADAPTHVRFCTWDCLALYVLNEVMVWEISRQQLVDRCLW